MLQDYSNEGECHFKRVTHKWTETFCFYHLKKIHVLQAPESPSEPLHYVDEKRHNAPLPSLKMTKKLIRNSLIILNFTESYCN